MWSVFHILSAMETKFGALTNNSACIEHACLALACDRHAVACIACTPPCRMHSSHACHKRVRGTCGYKILTSLVVMAQFVASPTFHSPMIFILTDRRYSELWTTTRWWCFDKLFNLYFLDFCWNLSVCQVANRLYWLCICHHQWCSRSLKFKYSIDFREYRNKIIIKVTLI